LGIPGLAMRQELPDRPGGNAVYDKLFGEFTGLYRRNRRAHARINRDRAHG